MTWLDVLLAIIIIATVYIGTNRGLIVEFFDLLLLVFAFTLGIYGKTFIADFLIRQFDWGKVFANWVGFLLIFTIFATLIFLLGCYVKDAVNAKSEIPKEVNQIFGGFLAAFKGILFGCLLLMLIGGIPNLSQSFRAKSGNGIVVRQVDKLIPGVEDLVVALSPKGTGTYLAKKINLSRFPTPENRLPNLGKPDEQY